MCMSFESQRKRKADASVLIYGELLEPLRVEAKARGNMSLARLVNQTLAHMLGLPFAPRRGRPLSVRSERDALRRTLGGQP